MRIDFNKLRTFITVAETGSVTRAAAMLHLTQQAVSHQIAALEQELAVTLFVRANRQIFLTPEGRKVLAGSRQGLLAIETELLGMKEGAQSLRGNIVVGAVNEVAYRFVAPLIVTFKKAYPDIHFEIRPATDASTEEDILGGHIDLGLMVFTTHVNQLHCQPLISVPYVAVASKAFLKKHGKVSSFKQVVELPFIDFLPASPSFRTWIRINNKSLVSSSLTREPEVIVPDERLVKHFILKGVGFGVVPHYLVEEELAAGRLIELLPSAKKASAGIDLVTLKKRQMPAAIKVFINFALDNLRA